MFFDLMAADSQRNVDAGESMVRPATPPTARPTAGAIRPVLQVRRSSSSVNPWHLPEVSRSLLCQIDSA